MALFLCKDEDMISVNMNYIQCLQPESFRPKQRMWDARHLGENLRTMLK